VFEQLIVHNTSWVRCIFSSTFVVNYFPFLNFTITSLRNYVSVGNSVVKITVLLVVEFSVVLVDDEFDVVLVDDEFDVVFDVEFVYKFKILPPKPPSV